MDRNESKEAMLPEGMGFCLKHGREFVLREGCAGCLAEKKVEGSPKPVTVASSVVTPAVNTPEPTAKKNGPDYTASAECLYNPATVKELLDTLHRAENLRISLKEEIPAELLGRIDAIEVSIREITYRLKEAVEQHGSYQDIEAGDYAVKYRRIHKEFNADTFAEKFPEYPTVIKRAVDVGKLQGLVKGGLLTEDELKVKGILTEEQTFAFYIK